MRKPIRRVVTGHDAAKLKGALMPDGSVHP